MMTLLPETRTVRPDDLERLSGWLLEGARSAQDLSALGDQLCRKLQAVGIPVDRFGLFLDTLHPNVSARRFLWTGPGQVEVTETDHSLFSTDLRFHTVLPLVAARQAAVRIRLAEAEDLYEILNELRGVGFTDYLAQPLILTTGETHAASYASRHPLGFSAEQLAALDRLRLPLTRVIEAHLQRMNAGCIISAYVGRESGSQVLQGRIHRGDGKEIAAAILFADLAGFSELSNRLSGREVVEALNDAFDAVIPVVQAKGGEILKFLGDGFFAIFPYQNDAEVGDAVRAARDAIFEADQRLAEAPNRHGLIFRWALHAGQFHYGNIGGANRLDFTAIGRPVNYAARLLEAASELSLSRVASAVVAQHLDLTVPAVAEFEFKGFDGLHPILPLWVQNSSSE